MPEPKRPLKVFLCHAHADRDPVRGLYSRLTQDGVDAWLDKAKLLPGQDWELEIRKAVREADVVVVCLSKQFNQAGFRQKEVRLALDTAMEKPEGEIFIIPARLEECDNLESLRKWHWVDLFEDDGYEMLMRALRARANKIDVTLQINSAVREKQERETVEKARREKDKKKVEKARLERERMTSEADAETDREIKKYKATVSTPQIGGRVAYWIAGFVVLVFGVGLLSSLNGMTQSPEPTATNTRLVNTSTPSKTPEPTSTVQITVTPMVTETTTSTAFSPLSVPVSLLSIGKWTIIENSYCTANAYFYFFYLVDIKNDGTFTRGQVTEVLNGKTTVNNGSDNQGTWALVGDEITLLFRDKKLVGKLDGNKMNQGRIYRTNSIGGCWNAAYNN